MDRSGEVKGPAALRMERRLQLPAFLYSSRRKKQSHDMMLDMRAEAMHNASAV